MSAELVALSSLTQLDSLQLHGLAIWPCTQAEGEQLRAVLLPLTQLMRLELRFEPERDEEEDSDDYDYLNERDNHWDNMEHSPAFPWQRAVCVLSKLQELHVSLDAETTEWHRAMFKGDLLPALSQLTALRRLSVLGMELWDLGEESDQLQLTALPALEMVALRLHTFHDSYPGLCHHQPVVLSRLVSLSLALCYEFEPDNVTHLPALIGPALTEFVLDDMMLAADAEQLSWLPNLPVLRRLVLKDVKTAGSELPRGIVLCSSLTELVLERIKVGDSYDPECDSRSTGCLLSSLPGVVPYLIKLRRLSVSGNAFTGVPSWLAGATALEQLDLADQQLPAGGDIDDKQAPRVHGLHVLGSLPRLLRVDLSGFNKYSTRRFQAAHPSVNVVL